MPHVPHLYAPPPWREDVLQLDAAARHHVERVLRRPSGAEVTYTDGAGTLGTGTYGDGLIIRGAEQMQPALPKVVVAVAPPHASDRCRFLVEKCAEVGVSEVVWLRTRYGEGRPPKPEKAMAWCIAAMQQSRGCHLTGVRGPTAVSELDPDSMVVADVAGGDGESMSWRPPVTVVIGPEGGFAADELPPALPRWRLGERVLRTETAAVVAAATALQLVQAGRSNGSEHRFPEGP
jgi:16S rRNA (uracil1498-N3)-methyltransferase